MNKNFENIAKTLNHKGNLKQEVYKKTLDVFDVFKDVLRIYSEKLNKKCKGGAFTIEYKENGIFEAQIKFAGDLLFFNMHSNVFGFPPDYFVHQTPYVKENPDRQYCGMIEVYNFLADSMKYSRYMDAGYLVARIFVNHEGHFFVEGEDTLGFLYKDFDNMVINRDFIELIVEAAIMFSVNFDLWIPKYHEVREITVAQKLEQTGVQNHKTAKRLGFVFQADNDNK
jgi:hypothetical protein